MRMELWSKRARVEIETGKCLSLGQSLIEVSATTVFTASTALRRLPFAPPAHDLLGHALGTSLDHGRGLVPAQR
jgi:hypothetical protein